MPVLPLSPCESSCPRTGESSPVLNRATFKPFVPLAACAGAALLLLAVTSGLKPGAYHQQRRAVPLGVSATRLAESDQALGLYARATGLLAAGRNREALAALDEAAEKPLVLAGNGDTGLAPADIAAPSLLMRLNVQLCAHAVTRANAGDTRAAHDWVRRARALADQILATVAPTRDALLAARAIDVQAGRAEAIVARRTGEAGVSEKIARREKAFRAFYERAVMAEIKLFQSRREAVLWEAVRGLPSDRNSVDERAQALARAQQTLDQEEAVMAADLLSLYTAERRRVLLPGGPATELAADPAVAPART